MSRDERTIAGAYDLGAAEILGSLDTGFGWGNSSDFHCSRTQCVDSWSSPPPTRSTRSPRAYFRAMALAWRGFAYSRVAISAVSIVTFGVGIILK